MKNFTIITVCLNESDKIERTVQSVIEQTYTDFQYVVIDGGSTDGTLDILEKHKDRIDILISEQDKGIYNAMNKGWRLATGNYVFYLNGGDHFYNSNVLKDVLSNSFDADIVYGYKRTTEGRDVKKGIEVITKEYLSRWTLPHQATFTRKVIFEKLKGFDESFVIRGDHDFFLRAILKYKATTKYIPVRVSLINLEGISYNNQILGAKETKRTVKQNFSYIERLLIYMKVRKILFKEGYYVRKARNALSNLLRNNC